MQLVDPYSPQQNGWAIATHAIFTRLIAEAYETADQHGWHDDVIRDADGKIVPAQMLSFVSLIHSEIGEFEVEVSKWRWFYRRESDGKPEGIASELADIMIRCCDTAGILGFKFAGEPVVVESLRLATDHVTELVMVQGAYAPAVETGLQAIAYLAFRTAYRLQPHFDGPVFVEVLRAKLAFNRNRSYRHGGKLA